MNQSGRLPPGQTRWLDFAVQVQKDAKLWTFLLALLVAVRGALVAAHRGQLDSATDAGVLLAAFASGVRYDYQVATWVTLPALLMSVVGSSAAWTGLADRVRFWLGAVVVALSVVIGGIDIGYVGEYGNQFDHFLLGVVFDDFRAIVTTIWASYPVVWGVMSMAVLVTGLVWLLHRWLRTPFVDALLARRPPPTWARGVLVGVLSVLVVAGARGGSLGWRPLQEKDAATTADRFLNRLIPTPYHALWQSLGDYPKLQRTAGLASYVPDGDLVRAASVVFPDQPPHGTVDDYLLRVAPGSADPPRHVFLLIMESYDAWPFAERYRSLGLTEGVRELGRAGILVTRFVPASTGTMSSLSALLTGLPDVGVYTDYQPAARQPFPSSPAAIFKRLGYRTRVFYSGYLSWHRIGDFCASQGFEEVHGGGAIDGGTSGNEWGVEDESLFGYVEQHVPADRPSFNVIITTSYHPPFNVDVRAKGFALQAVPPDLAPIYDGGSSLAIFGHLWYSDRAASRFIRAMDQRLPKALFALTGDHWSRRFLNHRPTFWERSTVPLLLYGPSVLGRVRPPDAPVGGHLDIAPTLIELSAPAGFAYHSLGENLLMPKRRLGLGNGRIIGPDYLAEISEPVVIHPLPDQPPPAAAPDPEALRRLYNAWSGLGWWRILKGNALPAARSASSDSAWSRGRPQGRQ